MDIEKYFQRELKSFHKNFRKLKRSFNPDTVHALRLNVKRTRALLQFLRYVEPELSGYHFSKKPFKRLFKLAGNVRDIQVQHEIARKTASSLKIDIRPYSRHLRVLEKKAVKIFTDKLIHTNIDVGLERQNDIQILIRNLEHIDEIRIKTIQLLNEKIWEINSYYPNLEDEKSIHDIRIILKQILYVFSFTRKFICKELFLNLTFKKIKRIESYFGDWHDRLNALIFLERFLKDAGPKDKTPYLMLKQNFLIQKEEFARNINLALHKELNFNYVLEI